MVLKKYKSQRDADIAIHKIDARVRIVQAVIPWIGGSIIAGFCAYSIQTLAGKLTTANISLMAEAGITGKESCPAWYVVAVFALIALLSVIFAFKQRKLRKDTIERLHPYQTFWEQQYDPLRASSLLTARGDTRKEDK